jgi:hypothetical protein
VELKLADTAPESAVRRNITMGLNAAYACASKAAAEGTSRLQAERIC